MRFPEDTTVTSTQAVVPTTKRSYDNEWGLKQVTEYQKPPWPEIEGRLCKGSEKGDRKGRCWEGCVLHTRDWKEAETKRRN